MASDGLFRKQIHEPGFAGIVDGDLRDGVHRNPDRRLEWFTTAYFHRPDELQEEVGEAGFEVRALVGVEGPLWLMPDLADRLAGRGPACGLNRTPRAASGSGDTQKALYLSGARNG